MVALGVAETAAGDVAFEVAAVSVAAADVSLLATKAPRRKLSVCLSLYSKMLVDYFLTLP